MSPGRKPSRSPASTAGRVRMILPTWRSARAATASAIARYVLPVPAGPIAKVTVWSRIASTYCFCMTVFGAIFFPRWRQTTSSNTSRMSSASSMARTTAPTVSGPISWPPSTSSTSSSTTARASETCVASPSIVSTLPRSRIVHWRRSRSASRTPSPTPASSAATSFETGKLSCTRFSLGKRLDPPMARMHELESALQPRALFVRQSRERLAKVVLVLLAGVLRLVQELDLRNDSRNPAGRAEGQLLDRPLDPRVSPTDPNAVFDVVQEELTLLGLRLPGVRRWTASGRAEEHLMDRKGQEFALLPGQPAVERLELLPTREVLLKLVLVAPENPDLEIFVLSRHPVEKEVDRPAPADIPPPVEVLELGESRCDVAERA